MLVNFILGGSVCFVSTLPFGPINLTVARTTVEKNHLRAFEMAIAAALVEPFQVLVALWFGLVIGAYLENSFLLRAAIASAFLLLGLVIFRRDPVKSPVTSDHFFGSEIKTGLLVAIANPQAIPFWIVALATLNDYTMLELQAQGLILFLAGVFVGKLLALTGFIAVSSYLKQHLEESSRLMNHALGSVLILIGLLQWLRLLVGIWPR